MTRRITVDIDTSVGYNYLLKKYFVENQSTTTYRESVQEIKKVLDIVAYGNTIAESTIRNLSTTYESLETLKYTLTDTGAYISSIQFNDYEKYPLILNCSKQVMYIGSSNLIFDLTLDESIDLRVDNLQEFYRDYLGLLLDKRDLLVIYNLLISFYNPLGQNTKCVYNLIADPYVKPLTYSNKIILSNWNNKGLAVYNCTTNPNNKSTLNPTCNITNIDNSVNKITCLSNIPNTIQVGDKIDITGSTVNETTYSYSADGTYTVSSIQDNSIIVEEGLSASYEFPFQKTYLQSSTCIIESIDRDTSTITLHTTIPNTIQVGDIIYVAGTQQQINNETLSCDGYYTVGSINDNDKKIIVQETLPTNFDNTHNTISTCTLSKHLYISNILSINNKVIQLQNNIPYTITDNTSKIVIENNNTYTTYTVTNHTTDTITVSESIDNYTPIFPQVNIISPDTSILLEVTSTKYSNIFPITTFVLDNLTELQEYIQLLPNLPYPSETIYNNVLKEVPTTREISLPVSTTITSMEFIGLYSQVYVE